jgi:tyrosinase
MPDLNQLQAQADELLAHSLREPQALARGVARRRPFSVFNPDDMLKVHRIAAEFSEIARRASSPEDALEEVFRKARAFKQTEDTELIQYALMYFMLHDPIGRKLEIAPIEVRAPQLVFPSTSFLPSPPRPTSNTEPELEWFREDPKLSQHHEHWHLVYSWAVPPAQLRDRQGEIFIYMHQQMLARYDTERLALRLPLTVPFDDYSAQITEIYDPGPPLSTSYTPRTIAIPMQDTPDYRVVDLKSKRDEIRAAVKQGLFLDANSNRLPISPENLGATIEASSGSASFDGDVGKIQHTKYGSVHNFGHDLISQVMDPSGHRLPPGVMSQPVVSQRDPIFWRWHRQIDDFSYDWQEKQKPHTYDDAVAGVSIRKVFHPAPGSFDSIDTILSFKDRIGAAGNPSFDGRQFGQQQFGGTNWNKDFSASAITTPFLETYMLQRLLPNQQIIEYLDQREFVYFLRVENSNDHTVEVTVRIYLIAKEFVGRPDERRYWIEMDKFREALAPGNNVIYRPAELSSVIQKPAQKFPHSRSGSADGDPCTCGWPYNLLLPRARKAGVGEEGMRFRLLVFLTDWNKDKVQESNCGSLSFCGAKDRYPDARSMGYPFDRPFATSITSLIEQSAPMAARDFSIIWNQALPPSVQPIASII